MNPCSSWNTGWARIGMCKWLQRDLEATYLDWTQVKGQKVEVTA